MCLPPQDDPSKHECRAKMNQGEAAGQRYRWVVQLAFRNPMRRVVESQTKAWLGLTFLIYLPATNGALLALLATRT